MKIAYLSPLKMRGRELMQQEIYHLQVVVNSFREPKRSRRVGFVRERRITLALKSNMSKYWKMVEGNSYWDCWDSSSFWGESDTLNQIDQSLQLTFWIRVADHKTPFWGRQNQQTWYFNMPTRFTIKIFSPLPEHKELKKLGLFCSW